MVERFGDEALVFLAESDRWVRLNRTATELLESIQADGAPRLTAGEVASRLRRQYDLEAGYAAEIAAHMLEDWSRAGIVRPVPDEEEP